MSERERTRLVSWNWQREAHKGATFLQAEAIKAKPQTKKGFCWVCPYVQHPQTEWKWDFFFLKSWSQPHKYIIPQHTHTDTLTHTAISQNTAAIKLKEQKWHFKKIKNTKKTGEKIKIPWKTPALQKKKKKQGNHHLVISHNKIFKNSLYRGLSSVIITLIYGKETTKIYICILSYVYAVCVYIYIYISINHFKSLCGKNKRSVTERVTNSRRRRASNSSYTPAELRKKKIKV